MMTPQKMSVSNRVSDQPGLSGFSGYPGEDSLLNFYSTPSSRLSDDQGDKEVTFEKSRKIVSDIIDGIFDDKIGIYEASSSTCSSVHMKHSDYTYDKRLLYWKKVLEERKLLAANIKRKTGKARHEVLFNRASTVDAPNKQTVQRLMDYANRMNPVAVLNRKQLVLPEYEVQDTCVHANELFETLPKAERDRSKIVEISGLPAVTKEEQLGSPLPIGTEEKAKWLKSKVLESRVEDIREDIERVIEYYPDIENLQIVGASLSKSIVVKHNPEIAFLAEDKLKLISSDTSLCNDEAKTETKVLEEEEPVDYGVKINEQVFKSLTKRSSKIVEVEIRFECEPFETVIKRVLRVENVGIKVLQCEWAPRSYYQKTSKLLKSLDQEFLFNHKPFRLFAGEVREIYVQFQPRRVDVVKEKWVLRIDPQFFCRKYDAVSVKLSGKCKPPLEYVQKLNSMSQGAIDKSNTKMMAALTKRLASLTPMVEPHEALCPYQRLLDERELFEFNNAGYKCERYHDLELLKEMYKRLKKPREPAWDLTVDSIKVLILRQPDPARRALLFDELVAVLDEMKGTPAELEEKLEENPERDQSRFVYVRGIICTAIDEWEELTLNVEATFLKPAFQAHQEQVAEEEDEKDVAQDLLDTVILPMDEDEVKQFLLKKVRRRKVFRDTLYVQTYTHMCNFVEDIVSVIESTEVI